MKPRKLLYGILAILFLVVFLQIFKVIIENALPEAIFCNAGGPWGISVSSPWLIALGLFAFFFLAIQWWREPGQSQSLLWLVLLGAGASNLWERLRYGCVSDYLSLGFSFNGADALLTVGVITLFYNWYIRSK